MCPRILALSRHYSAAQDYFAMRFVSRFATFASGIGVAKREAMIETSVSQANGQVPYSGINARELLRVQYRSQWNVLHGLKRRWHRERRRRKVGRAYDMALEIARLLPGGSSVLDVGCGNGFIAHHLSALLNSSVTGIDLAPAAEAAIDYRRFDGKFFPVEDQTFDAVLLCYVLHHAQQVGVVMEELRRVLSKGGYAVVFEDIPAAWWDRLICWTHDLKWRKRTGACTFRSPFEWQAIFNEAGFEVVNERVLSRWRNLAHPVQRRRFVLRRTLADMVA
jgi:SAM-dependent methyltransferase